MLHLIVGAAVAAILGTRAPGLDVQSPPTQAAQLPLASLESRWNDVYCDLMQLSRTSPSELTVRFRYRNQRKTPFRPPNVELVSMMRVFDPENQTLFGVLKDPAGKPVSSIMLNGAVARQIPANTTQVHWARLEAPPGSVTAVSVLIDGCLPFESATIGATPVKQPVSKPKATTASQDGEADGLAVEITGLNRASGGLVDLTFRYRNTGTAPYRFPSTSQKSRTASAYMIDSSSRRKFEVARDKIGKALCSESLAYSGALGETLEPGESLNLWAKFPAPPESATSVSVFLPLAPPFDNLSIAGAGTGSAGGGSAVAGVVVGLDAALEDLAAKVTDTEIRIDLSADVLFDLDKSDLKPAAEEKLTALLTVVNSKPGSRVAIEGHTDVRGEAPYNQALSERRAGSVSAWLVGRGVPAARVSATGAGETRLLRTGNTDADHQANRRVEIRIRN